ncbi:MAG: Fe-S-binding domain-containing protein, partial [Bacteroidia bacterium]
GFLAATGVIVAAVYLLWAFRRMMFGTLDKEENRKLVDLSRSEVAILMPLIILMFVMGFWASPFLKHINASSDKVVAVVLKKNGMAPQVAPASEPASVPVQQMPQPAVGH